MNTRDEKIRKHIGRYGLTTRAVLERLFFDGATCDNVINRLIKEGRIVSQSGIPGGLCCYRLSLAEARALGVPEHRAKPLKGAALRRKLQVLWFCCMSDKKRTLLERKQVATQFGNGRGSGQPHCAEAHDGDFIVYRVHTPGPNSSDRYLLKSLQGDFDEGTSRLELSGWIEGKRFGFAVLVETSERKERLRRLISKNGPHDVRIIVEVVPGLSNIAVATRRVQEESCATVA